MIGIDLQCMSRNLQECNEAWGLNVTRKEKFIEGESRRQFTLKGNRNIKRSENYKYFSMERLENMIWEFKTG
jgi:hypothetical protein